MIGSSDLGAKIFYSPQLPRANSELHVKRAIPSPGGYQRDLNFCMQDPQMILVYGFCTQSIFDDELVIGSNVGEYEWSVNVSKVGIDRQMSVSTFPGPPPEFPFPTRTKSGNATKCRLSATRNIPFAQLSPSSTSSTIIGSIPASRSCLTPNLRRQHMLSPRRGAFCISRSTTPYWCLHT